ncbi:MAG: DUF2157 domain-containing protein [Roseitalea porphyridii]|uniref:DUF2157 domain-containing protein n=1 Tax=Roseitalea porphyridii TaxID=1852022 RepID=UPI0032EC1A6F
MASWLEHQIRDWRNRGVIDDAVAAALVEDVRKGVKNAPSSAVRRFSFFRIVALFAAVSFAAAILMFISANWEAIPRLVKAAGVMALIGAGLVGGALVRSRGGRIGPRLEEAFYLVAGAAYVGGVALVGQMYHLPGTIGEAMAGFALGLGIAGVLVRGNVLLAGALGALAWWYVETPNAANLLDRQFAIVVAVCAAGFIFAHLTGMRRLRIVAIAAVLVSMLPFLIATVVPWIIDMIEAAVEFYQGLPEATRIALWLLVLVAGVIILWLSRGTTEGSGWAQRLAPAIGFALGVGALAVLHAESETLLPLIVVGPLALAFALFALFAHGAASRPIRYLAYALFVGEILFLYAATVATLLGTAGFFFAIGPMLTVLAAVIYASEQRFRRRAAGSER